MTEIRLPRDRRTQLERLVDLWFARWERERIRAQGGRMPDLAIDPCLAAVPAAETERAER
ncbi:MAG: hypothetical protein F4Y47_00230 [Acidobacteriia bacterium]|nr:hypothetical protein [Terriglobia bacterium]MYG04409.1 hypothetical protein [Terriglobia bacterium]MYK11274.1 hypothetical protein [Terriglobia bacterium]